MMSCTPCCVICRKRERTAQTWQPGSIFTCLGHASSQTQQLLRKGGLKREGIAVLAMIKSPLLQSQQPCLGSTLAAALSLLHITTGSCRDRDGEHSSSNTRCRLSRP